MATVTARMAQVIDGWIGAALRASARSGGPAARVSPVSLASQPSREAISARSLAGARRSASRYARAAPVRSPVRTRDAASCFQARHVSGPSGAWVALIQHWTAPASSSIR